VTSELNMNIITDYDEAFKLLIYISNECICEPNYIQCSTMGQILGLL